MAKYFANRPPEAADGNPGDLFLDTSELESLRLPLYGPKATAIGTRQSINLTILGGPITTEGMLDVTIQYAGLEDGAPQSVAVFAELGKTAAQIAAVVRDALMQAAFISDIVKTEAADNVITVTAVNPAENDPGFSLAVANGAAAGLVDSASVPGDEGQLIVDFAGKKQEIVATVNVPTTITADGALVVTLTDMGTNYVASVPVTIGMTGVQVAVAIRDNSAALQSGSGFLIRAVGATVEVEVNPNPRANDPTLNLAIAAGTAVGLVDTPTSAVVREGAAATEDPTGGWSEVRIFAHGQIIQTTSGPTAYEASQLGTKLLSTDALLWNVAPMPIIEIYGPKHGGWGDSPYADIDEGLE